ncbi:MAG: hypothetical protein Q8N60_02990, partial [Candidatus Diapherotrites archaeon]|nr:hypothetical protein [Candidatus Diapherotrites archaeon]
NPNDATIQWSKLVDLNRKLVEPLSERLAFIAEPMQLEVNFAPKGMDRLIVDKQQFDKLKEGDVVRLRELFNIRINRKDPLQTFSEFVGEAKINKPIMSWFRQGIDAEILMDDASKLLGLADAALAEKEAGAHMLLDGLGFCVVDKVEQGKAMLRFSHR